MREVIANALLGAAFVGGLLLAAVGVARVSLSAGLIVAGAMVAVGALVFERGRQP